MSALSILGPFDSQGHLNVVVETSQGTAVPFNHGYIPGTLDEVGDPLGVVVFLDEPVSAGSVVGARLIGVIGNGEGGECLIAVDAQSRRHAELESLEQDAPLWLLAEMDRFFTARGGGLYHHAGQRGPERAREILHLGLKKGFSFNSKAAGDRDRSLRFS